MDNLLSRFLTKIGIPDLTPYSEGAFSKLENDKENNRIVCRIKFPTYLRYDAYKVLFDTCDDFTVRGGFSIALSFEYDEEKEEFPYLLEDYKHAKKTAFLNDVQFFEGEKKVLFYYPSAGDAGKISEECRLLKDFLDSVSSSYSVLTQEKFFASDTFYQERDRDYVQKSREADERIKKQKEIDSTYQPCRLKDIENFRKVLVEGTIFKIEDRVTKKGRHIRKIEYTDGSDSISSTLFEGKKTTMEDMLKYGVGVKIRVQGRSENDEFARGELVLAIDDIEILPPDPLRQDTYPRKRIELHLHTKMSAFDGVGTMADYCAAAKRFGHTAIAVTDHGVAQDFPEAQKAGKKSGLKILYGSELYMVDDMPSFIYNPSDRILNEETFVVFDLETTGLSARYDRIIEFGAVKIDARGQILDEIDFFVRPDMKLSAFSIEKSHISQEQADSGKPIRKALEDILEFFGDAILVAHNAAFDYGFLNEALKNNGMPALANPVIDTLPIARYLYQDKRSHSEGAIAREMQIEFDETSAHRANYDAEMLSKVFEVMLGKLTENNKKMAHKELASLPVTDKMITSMHPYHTTVLVKNAAGLKDLYKIISESHVHYMSSFGLPLVPKSYLSKMRTNLLLGSACLNGEVFEHAMNKGEDILKRTLSFYDYIEIQPPANYVYLVNKGSLRSMEEVEKIIKDLIKAAKDVGKMVVATGDCHYVEPSDKIYRDVFIASKALHGARHPLNLAPYDSAREEVKKKWYQNPIPNPDQHFRTTDEMIECFRFLGDDKLSEEIVIDNTWKINEMIDPSVRPTKDKLYPPNIPGADKMLTDLVFETAKQRYGDPLPPEIRERLETELKGIIDNGYSVIYWISSKLVRWSNDCGYMIGSRGSVGSSLVATMSGITEVNPLPPHYVCPKCHHLEWGDVSQYESGFDLPEKPCPHCHTMMDRDGQNIPFATFLGFHAEKVPDIDLNFPSDFQATAHEHIKEFLGAKNVFKAGTIQTTKEKNARGYVLGYFESLGKDTGRVRNAEIDRIAQGCMDVKRTTGQHPGGVIVIPDEMEVYDFTPVQYPADEVDSSWKTTHYDFHAIHDNVLKFDMLGHVDPQAVKMMCDNCGISFKEIDRKVKVNDPEALSLFWSADALHLKDNVLQQETGALGLPEFGTETGRRTLLETKPRAFADLVRISGLSHGTDVYSGNAQDLILKDGLTLREVIACRDDIMVGLHEKYGIDYSDSFQIMETVRKGNFCKPGFEEKRAKYTALMKEHGVPDYYIHSCEKIQYLFPRGHAVAYVMMAMRCAYFKVHEPLSYYATYFTLRCDAYDIETMMKGIQPCLRRLAEIREKTRLRTVTPKETALINAYEQTIEMYDRGFRFGKIDVNRSLSTKFTFDAEKKEIIPCIACIDGIGAALGDSIVAAREKQPFTSIEDLKRRGKVGDKAIEVFRHLGALGDLPDSEQLTLF